MTTAGLSGTEDRKLRQRRYAQTQALRLTCFALAVLLPVPLWAKLALMVGAFVLPWMGVMAANGGPVLEKKRSTNVVEDVVQTVHLPISDGRTIDME